MDELESTESSESEDSYNNTMNFRHSGEWQEWKTSEAGLKVEEERANRKKLKKERRVEERKLLELEKKYKIDPEAVIEITIDQLPRNLKMKDLNAYLSQTYPNQYVKIYHSPLTQYGPFLPEVIANILKSDSRYLPSATRISKAVTQQAMVSYLDVECQKPISRGELLTYLEEGESAMLTRTSTSSMTVFWYQHYSTEEGVIIPSDIITPSVNTELAWIRTPGYKSVGTIYVLNRRRKPIFVKDIDTNVDMFTEYEILSRRKKCVELDKYFALRKLLQRYNGTIAKELNEELEEVDVERVFYLEQLVYGLGIIRKKSIIPDTKIDLYTQEKTRAFLEPIFLNTRLLIRHKIVSEHKVKISPYNEFVLSL